MAFSYNCQCPENFSGALCERGMFTKTTLQSRTIEAIFLDLFLSIFVRAFLNVDLINDFQLKISCAY